MTTARARRFEVSPAALGSIALHAAVAAAFMVSWGSRDLKVGSVVPVTIVSSAPDVDTRPAVQGPETLTAQTEEPVAEAPPEPAPPPPQPAPPPPSPKAAPKPAEKAPAPAPKAAAKPAEKSLDLDALAASLTRPARNAPQRPSSAAQGASRPETAPVARQTTGSGLAAGAALQGLAEELQRRWNPNCEVEGGRDVLVRVTFRLGVGGQVVGDVSSEIRGARTPVSQAAAERAVRAVYAAAPFRGLPREFYGDRIAVNFNAREACDR
ncbi:energy transducer TonB [Phenylobacterium kunshanense]|uniref:Energy transducer TonB n=1 Tax=Phenylobacterium kunshanense TaxID=1445034 RepID=A0A328BBI7_9CAUL|nr:energy transducer TonB [Phenylobacterium kunshanense]RAK64417.1 energy transducer TonB [Phenylobacterium kunshanense]